MLESKSNALPLGYIPILGRNVGIEPTHAGSTNQCVNPFTNSAITVHMGFEPMISSVTGRRDKPLLQWTKLEEDVGFEPTRGRTA